MSQQKFAETIGANKGNMASYECGNCHPPLKVIKRILEFAEILNEDAYDFIYNSNFEYTKPTQHESVKFNG
jgi:transcriptional regulator with XRE-family HTH domain